MARYLRDNWPWIAAPLVVVAALLVLLYAAGDESWAPFSYALF